MARAEGGEESAEHILLMPSAQLPIKIVKKGKSRAIEKREKKK